MTIKMTISLHQFSYIVILIVTKELPSQND